MSEIYIRSSNADVHSISVWWGEKHGDWYVSAHDKLGIELDSRKASSNKGAIVSANIYAEERLADTGVRPKVWVYKKNGDLKKII